MMEFLLVAVLANGVEVARPTSLQGCVAFEIIARELRASGRQIPASKGAEVSYVVRWECRQRSGVPTS
jgi:hypothetical protein